MALPRPVITADDGGLIVSLTLAGRRDTVAGRDLYIAMVIAAAEVLNGADERELEWSRHNLQRKLQVCLSEPAPVVGVLTDLPPEEGT